MDTRLETIRENAERAGAIQLLIERLQHAPEGSRVLDYDIHELVHPYLKQNGYRRSHGDEGYESDHPPITGGRFIAPPQHYTDSIDAALDLVPDGFAADVSRYTSGTGDARLWQGDRHIGPYGASTWLGDSRPASPAIALCIVALKARMPIATA